jgi:hypothetical protein
MSLKGVFHKVLNSSPSWGLAGSSQLVSRSLPTRQCTSCCGCLRFEGIAVLLTDPRRHTCWGSDPVAG